MLVLFELITESKMQIVKKIFFMLIFVLCIGTLLKAQNEAKGEESKESEFNAVESIMAHVSDANEWHLWTTTDEEGKEHHFSLPLPIIVWDGQLKAFMSSKVAHGKEYQGYTLKHGVLTSLNGKKKAGLLDVFGGMDSLFIDFSITKNIAAMFFSMLLLLFVFITMSRSYSKNNLKPRGVAALLEPVVLFIRDEIAIPNIGRNKYDRFLPYLLTVFFFIWFNNLLGLIPIFPGGANVTGNIAVTFVLAIFTALIVNLSGNKNYWKHIFNTPGVPKWMLPIMIPVEIISIFTKPFALMMRLFANITAGHIMLLSIISLIFIFKTPVVALGSVPLALFVSVLELLVATLQAYIFTVLSALFMGLAVADEH